MKILETHNELRSFIKDNEIALIAFLDMKKPNDRYFHDLLMVLERRAGYMISFALVDVSKNSNSQALLPQDRKTPLIRLYIKGIKTFEQEGCFGEFLSDLAALKQGIKEVLKSRGYKTLF